MTSLLLDLARAAIRHGRDHQVQCPECCVTRTEHDALAWGLGGWEVSTHWPALARILWLAHLEDCARSHGVPYVLERVQAQQVRLPTMPGGMVEIRRGPRPKGPDDPVTGELVTVVRVGGRGCGPPERLP